LFTGRDSAFPDDCFFHTSFSSTSSILFPLLTSFLMVFHITIACFMGMKYWSSKRRLYLTPVAFGFACSALLMLGTLSSYPDWLTCNPPRSLIKMTPLSIISFAI
jgi:hypothetical protein